jgi:hypothetical protein
VKIKRVISSLLSAVLATAILIGSTGFTVIIKKCHASGISASTDLLKTADSCCGTETSDGDSDSSDRMGSVCCTFETGKMVLPNFVKTENITFISLAEIQPVTDILSVPEIQEQKIFPTLIIHNKHGGRFILTSNCQFLI